MNEHYTLPAKYVYVMFHARSIYRLFPWWQM